MTVSDSSSCLAGYEHRYSAWSCTDISDKDCAKDLGKARKLYRGCERLKWEFYKADKRASLSRKS